jgi:hypothetical protein
MSQNPVSPKVTAAALATAVTTIVFVVLAIFKVFPQDVDPGLITALQGGVATVLTFALGYLVKDENREQGKGVPTT